MARTGSAINQRFPNPQSRLSPVGGTPQRIPPMSHPVKPRKVIVVHWEAGAVSAFCVDGSQQNRIGKIRLSIDTCHFQSAGEYFPLGSGE
jgi:hypothetical protein